MKMTIEFRDEDIKTCQDKYEAWVRQMVELGVGPHNNWEALDSTHKARWIMNEMIGMYGSPNNFVDGWNTTIEE